MTGALLAVLADLSISGTMVRLQPTLEPGARAEVLVENVLTNGPHDTGAYALTDPGLAPGGLTVGLHFTWDADPMGSDRLVVIPPDGMACRPADCTATVPEGGAGVIVLFDWVGF